MTSAAPFLGLRLKLAFFDGESLLAADTLDFSLDEKMTVLESAAGHRFETTYAFEDPACPMFVRCLLNGELLYRSAFRVGVANSEDWERIDLVGNHCMLFQRIVPDVAS